MNNRFHRSVPPFRRERPHRPLAPVHGLGTAAAVLVGATAPAAILLAWVDWRAWSVAQNLSRRVPGVLQTDAYAARVDSVTVRVLFLVLMVNATAQFLAWLWRARRNAEVLHRAVHRRDRPWVVWGWFCPGVNLWFPYMVVRDVWETSDPRTPAYRYELGKNLGARRLAWWWFAWLVAEAAHATALVVMLTDDSLDGLRARAVAEAVAAGAQSLAAVLLIETIVEISAWQTARAGRRAH